MPEVLFFTLSHPQSFFQIYPGAVELMQVTEEFIHIVGLGMKDFHNAYLMTGNLGKAFNCLVVILLLGLNNKLYLWFIMKINLEKL